MISLGRRAWLGDDALGLLFGQVDSKMARILGLDGNDQLRWPAGHQEVRLGDAMDLACGEDESKCPSQTIDGDMDLAAQPAVRPADGLVLSPPLAACLTP